MIGYKTASLVGILLFLLIWLILFYHKKNVRREMVLMSFLIAPLGPISELFYFKDYWKPNYLLPLFGFGVEDLFFAFLIGGIAAVIYEELFVRKYKNTKPEKDLHIFILVLAGLLSMLVFNLILGFNSIYVSSVTFFIIGTVILFKRRDLIRNAVFSGLLVAFIMFLFYLIYIKIFPNIITNWWQLDKISGILIFGVPLEEIIWGFAWGFIAGPFYEFWKGKKEAKK